MYGKVDGWCSGVKGMGIVVSCCYGLQATQVKLCMNGLDIHV